MVSGATWFQGRQRETARPCARRAGATDHRGAWRAGVRPDCRVQRLCGGPGHRRAVHTDGGVQERGGGGRRRPVAMRGLEGQRCEPSSSSASSGNTITTATTTTTHAHMQHVGPKACKGDVAGRCTPHATHTYWVQDHVPKIPNNLEVNHNQASGSQGGVLTESERIMGGHLPSPQGQTTYTHILTRACPLTLGHLSMLV